MGVYHGILPLKLTAIALISKYSNSDKVKMVKFLPNYPKSIEI